MISNNILIKHKIELASPFRGAAIPRLVGTEQQESSLRVRLGGRSNPLTPHLRLAFCKWIVTALKGFAMTNKGRHEYFACTGQPRRFALRCFDSVLKKSGAIAPLFWCQFVILDVVSYSMQRHAVYSPFPTDLQSLAYSEQPFACLGQHPFPAQYISLLGH